MSDESTGPGNFGWENPPEDRFNFGRMSWQLAMLAATLPRTEEGLLDYKAACGAWYDAELFLDQVSDRECFPSLVLEMRVPWDEAPEKLNLLKQNLRDTLNRKLDRMEFTLDERQNMIGDWMINGIEPFWIKLLRNKAKKS